MSMPRLVLPQRRREERVQRHQDGVIGIGGTLDMDQRFGARAGRRPGSWHHQREIDWRFVMSYSSATDWMNRAIWSAPPPDGPAMIVKSSSRYTSNRPDGIRSSHLRKRNQDSLSQ
jgi:hypothetical protein